MKFLSSVGIGLSVVFCFLLLALVVETYYLLWWKRRITGGRDQIQDDNSSNPTREMVYIFCWKTKKTHRRITEDNNAHQSETGFGFYLKAGLMMGPPRFLFTIKEETKEDLESEEDKAKGVSRRLSDLMRNEDNTPFSSPAFFTPPLTPSMGSSHSISYNPFHESSTDVEFNMIRSSPPPKLKFLRDAEEKLQKKNANCHGITEQSS